MFENLKKIYNRVKSFFVQSHNTGGKTEGVRKKETTPIRPNRLGDYQHVTVPDAMIGLSNADVFTYIATEAKGLQTADELYELGRIFAKWLNTKETSTGKSISTNTKRDLQKRCTNEIKAHDVMRIDLRDQVDMLASAHPEYADEIMSILVQSDGTEYTQAETIGKNKHDLLVMLGEEKALNVRDDVKALQINSHIIKWLYLYGISRSELELASNKENTQLTKKHSNKVTVKMADMQSIIAYGLSAENKSYGRLAVALGLATGRRAIELLYTGHFKVIEGSKPLEFTGQAKKGKGVIAKPYPIYCVGCEPEEVVKGFKRLSKEIKDTSDETNKLPAHERNRFIKERTHSARLDAVTVAFNYDSDRTFKDTRAIYARICVDTMMPDDSNYTDKTEEIFIQDLLGHKSMEEQLHYKQFTIDYEADVSPKASPPKKFDTVYEGDEPTPFDNIDIEIESLEMHKRSRTALLLLNNKVKAYAIANPSTRITKTLIRKKIGCSAKVADNYLGAKDKQGKIKVKGIAEDVIQTYNLSLS